MVTKRRKIAVVGLVLVLSLLAGLLVTACSSQADTASANLSQAADKFEVNRRIVFYNGVTGAYILVIEGKCSLGNYDSARELSVTCKVGDNAYKKHFLGLSDNVTFFAEQVDSVNVSPWYYNVTFKPTNIIPNIDLQVPGQPGQ